ncbi:MAG: LexA family protein [Christensenellaceae bacterium]
MYGAIACGQPIFSDENVEDMPLLPRVRTADFVLRCQGDSMIDANIFDGDYVYIHRQPDVENGTIAAVAIDGRITLKRVIRQQGCVLLQPCNNRYAAALYTPDNCDDIHIVGKAVGVYSDLDGR